MRRSLTMILLGAVAIAAGLVVLLVVVPSFKQLPANVDTTRHYEGTLGVMLNADALATLDMTNLFLRDVPVTIDRHVEVLQTEGEKALVSEVATLSGPSGPIQQTEDIYTINRKTMESIANFTSDDRVIPRQGLVIGWPIGTGAKDYTGWNGDTQSTTPLTFEGKEERAGLETYVFQATSEPEVIVDPELLAVFPQALPRDLITTLAPALGLPETALAQLSEVLPTLPDEIPLTYLYSFDKTYWVEPETGVLIDVDVSETRQAAVSVGGFTLPLTQVWQLQYTTTGPSVDDAVGDAESAKTLLSWVGKVLPWGLIVIGLLIVLLGAWRITRRKTAPTDA